MKQIWQEQLDRVTSNILAFIILGLISGFIVGGKSTLESWDWLNRYFEFANVSVDYASFGSSLLSEHLAPNSLTLILIFSFFFSAVHRIIYGAVETRPEEKKGVIYSLVNFGSLLAIAWLGLMLGIFVPAVFFDGWSTGFKFLIIAVYPLLFLVEVVFCLKLLYWSGINEKPDYIEDRKQWRRRTRIEGFVVLIAAVLLFTFNDQYQNTMSSLTSYLKSAL
ncbi:hypothetical protein HJ201_23680 [Vibrio parahaemolyticus]|uniref:hypothetical protein n=1 Tax=Vibrio parahaemolyticus TaxID=670 RepID=UPI001B83FB6E|nr:hypothetical protein [Vibrio parahaemolyticus]ELA8098837.1 hypothetical protein [Vibrio parahaemolyticus]MBE3757263.1 hypothetical protein [Vibrio parahaemolyticus]MDF4345743.1 hypothetical protein [Vibrio parahaemolyticus]MDF4358080.1 hypothetical protein [Vibrio parahaemolyticus]MDF4419670.1 hypothetical protein [Vibrio parahaemolyticus]